ncbi:hypothetical protein ACTFIZ_009819 [Dictyostelium cf. discoideum]
MDEPLFGERKKQTQISQIIISIIVAAFSLFSIAIGVYFGIKVNARHFVLVGTIIVIFGSLALLVKWWRDQDDRIHPKFKYLIFLLAGCVILASISLNCYVWVPKALTCNGLYTFENKTCMSVPDPTSCSCGLTYDPVQLKVYCTDYCPPPPDSSSNSTSSDKKFDEFDPEYDIFAYDSN